MPASRKIMARLSRALLQLAAFLARRSWLKPISDFYLRSLARAVVRAKGIRPAQEHSSMEALGTRWQMAFAGKKHNPIVKVTSDTVYGEILTECPLRGSGDTLACHRMMEYDREVMRHADAEFVVLRSQAQPGVDKCLVAMRRRGADLSDLRPAHVPDPTKA